ncbi:MAG: phosphoribosyltransferase family protein [Oscillospiraceae bacterium]
MDEKTYKIKIAGLERNLPICKAGENLWIASFVMFSDVELTVACARELLLKTQDFDVIVTAEAKGIPLAYEMSKQCGKKYIPARKMSKLYMEEPIKVEVKSISTDKLQTLYLDKKDCDYIKGKKVLLVDDVISGGDSIYALEVLTNKAGGKVVGKATVLAEGEASKRDDIIFLEELPLFMEK